MMFSSRLMILTTTSLLGMSLCVRAESKYLSRDEMAAYLIDTSIQMSAQLGNSSKPPKWRCGKMPINRLNPAFKPDILKVISSNNKLKGKTQRLTIGALKMLGYIANEGDLEVLERYMQEGIAIIKSNPGKVNSQVHPIDFFDLGTCIGIMIARNINGAKDFYLKYGDRAFWNKLNISNKNQMFIVGYFSGKVYVMSRYGRARKRALEYFYIKGKKQRALESDIFENIDKKYKVNKYITLSNPSNYLSPDMVKVFTQKMKERHPDMFAYFGIKVKPSIEPKQKANSGQGAKPLFDVAGTSADKKLPYLKNIKIYSTAKAGDLKIIENDAIKHYQIILNKFKKKDVSFLIYKIADNGKPLCPAGKMINKRRFESKGFLSALNETNVLIKAVEHAKPEYAPAIIELKTNKRYIGTVENYTLKGKNQRIVVTIPLLKTIEVSKKFKLQNSPRPPKVIDEHGNILITMIYQDGKWYWNPFGW